MYKQLGPQVLELMSSILPIGDESGTYVIRIGPYGTVWYVLLCFVNKDI
jgi:hypothetical protein